MAVKRMKNWLGQQRVDTPHLREIESAVAGDFDDLAGKVLASSQPIVVHGMTIAMGAAVGNLATQLVLNTAGSILLHGTASEPGAVFVVPANQAAETLSTSNPRIIGSFTPNAINYIGIDLVRLVDDSTADTVKFRSATTKKEFSQQVPLARTLQYRIIIAPQDFSQTPNVAPVAEVQLNASGVVQSVTDCRQMMFRLGTGGSVPNALAPYAWPGGRVENPVTSTTTADPFLGADKSISSFIDFFHAMESRLWEVGGGEHWYSQTTDRDVLFIRDATNVFVSNGENFEWTGTNIHWKGLSFDFGNSTATRNTINDQLVDSAGLTDLAVGQCIYVDVNRATDGAALTAHKANLATLSSIPPTIPGSRHIIAWRVTEGVFGLGQSTPVGFALIHATATVYGAVKLYANAGTDAVVSSVDVNGVIVARGLSRDTAGALLLGTGANDSSVSIGKSGAVTTVFGSLNVNQSATILSLFGSNSYGLYARGDGGGPGVRGEAGAGTNSHGVVGVGAGTGNGVNGTGGATNGSGVTGTGGATNGAGVTGQGTGTGTGVTGQGGATDGAGVIGTGGATNGVGVTGQGAGTGAGVVGTGGATNGVGVTGQGAGTGAGVVGTGGATNGRGVFGQGAGTGAGVAGTGGATNGSGLYGQGMGSGAGVQGTGGATNGPGLYGQGSIGGYGVVGLGGSTNAGGVTGTGTGTGTGVTGQGGATDGAGVIGTGGATNGVGVTGQGAGTGAGVVGFSVSGPGGQFTGNATKAALHLTPVTADPASLADGDVWIRNDTGTLHWRANGITHTVGP